MERLQILVGTERSLERVTQTLCFVVTRMTNSACVGAMHVTCADESENECANAFQRGFVQYLLPSLKFAQHSAFRIANLGGQYEWGAVRMAELHFAVPKRPDDAKILLVKVNAHVAMLEDKEGIRYGVMKRYQANSPCCGALDGLLQDGHQPFVDRLREVFGSEGLDRVAMLRDEKIVAPGQRSLYAAVVSARMQARKAILDIQDYEPASPTQYLVVPCVTVNRPEKDTEIVCGYYMADSRHQDRKAEYFGLGDDPRAYSLAFEHGRCTFVDPHLGTQREARDHRALAMQRLHRHRQEHDMRVSHKRMEQISYDVARDRHRDHRHGKLLLKALLVALSEVAPAPAAVLLFAHGLVGVHHAFRVHQLSQELEGSAEARRVLDEVHANVDRLKPDEAEAMIKLLMREFHQ